MSTKKAFDFTCSSIFVADPMQLCIIGGAALPDGQRGPVDTDEDRAHVLYDPRLRLPIDGAHLANVDAMGILEPVLITKLDGKPVVVDGRQRVRWARLVNAQRAERGDPPISVECKNVRSTELRLFSVMIGANEVRTDDSIPAKVEKIKRGKERGISDDDLAIAFGCTPAYVRQLLAFDDRAVDEVRAAVADGSIAPTAAMHLVRNAKSDDAQRSALAKLVESGEKPSTQRAVRAAKEESGEPVARRPTRKEIRARLERALENEEIAVVSVLKWVLGDE